MQGSHSRFIVLAFGGALSFIAGLLTFLLFPDCTERPLATIPEEVEVGQTKIINDSDLDFRDTSITSGFVPNIPAEDVLDRSQSSGSFNDTQGWTMSLLRRLANIVQRKTQMLLRPTSSSLTKLSCDKQITPISVMLGGGDVFEPVTGFVFKWDKAEPAVKISDFEKEMSAYWTPNNDPSEKKLNDKHLNSLNILYNIDRERDAVIDIQNSEEIQNASEHGTDSTL